MSQKNDWIAWVVPHDLQEQAKRLRQERDRLYPNRIFYGDTFCPWIGDLGEIVLDRWLRRRKVPAVWFRDEPGGKPDFQIDQATVDIKTVKRQVAPRPEYEAGVDERHLEHGDYFFFASYEVPTHTMTLLGAMERERLKRVARRFVHGENVHANYPIPEGAVLWNVYIEDLDPPRAWLDSLDRTHAAWIADYTAQEARL
jgi:hypothetical protein